MSKTLKTLPQLGNQLFLTDGGLETSLIFLDGFELPYFAAFHLLRNPKGREALTRYYERYIAIAKADDLGFILESPTWRAGAFSPLDCFNFNICTFSHAFSNLVSTPLSAKPHSMSTAASTPPAKGKLFAVAP